MRRSISKDKKLMSYVVGLALGDGNLSNPNGRAVRLRITCDKKYPELLKHIKNSVERLMPNNKVSIVSKKDRSVDISCYSNQWEKILGWKAGGGSKLKQGIKIPKWIFRDSDFVKECLRGIIQTDGSIFKDRRYTHINIVSHIPTLARSIKKAIESLGYKPNIQILKTNNGSKFTIRVSKYTEMFIDNIKLWKK